MTVWLHVAALVLALAPADDAAQRGQQAYARGDYDTAAAALAEAYDADPQPAYLYARAQAERYGGHCDTAVVHYQAFLDTGPDAKAAEAARTNLEACRSELAQAEPAPVAEAPAPAPEEATAPPPAPIPADTPAPAVRPWHRDPLGGALVGAGAVVTAIGAGLYVTAKADERRADRAGDVETYGQRIERAATLSRVAIPVMAIGGAVLVGGVVRWIVVARRGRQGSSRAAQVRAAPGGMAVRF